MEGGQVHLRNSVGTGLIKDYSSTNLTTPLTHLHREPQAELLVLRSSVSGSNVGFFRYGSTRESVASGNC